MPAFLSVWRDGVGYFIHDVEVQSLARDRDFWVRAYAALVDPVPVSVTALAFTHCRTRCRRCTARSGVELDGRLPEGRPLSGESHSTFCCVDHS